MVLRTLSLALVLTVAAGTAAAGPMDPPAGAVSSTFKTLVDVEPRTIIDATNTPGDGLWTYIISKPGSYYLTQAMTSALVGNKGGIRVAADNVVIDLNGFTITGTDVESRAGIGSPDRNVATVVRNGAIAHFGGYGVSLGESALIDGVRASDCGTGGFEAWERSTLVDCTATSCNSYGFKVWGDTTSAERCSASWCQVGFNGPYRLTHCTARRCWGAGFYVYVVAEGCDALTNTSDGFKTFAGALVTNCTSTHNSHDGFSMGNNSRAFNCSGADNDNDGFNLGASAAADHCSAGGNGHAAVSVDGFYARVVDCTLSGAVSPTIALNAAVPGVEVSRNHINGGTYAVGGPAAINALIVGNHCVAQSSGFTSVPLASNQVGPVVSTNGTIASTSPWANFVR